MSEPTFGGAGQIQDKLMFPFGINRGSEPAFRAGENFGGLSPTVLIAKQDYCGNPTFLRRAVTRGSPRSKANSGELRARPTRTAPFAAKRSSASRVRSLSPK